MCEGRESKLGLTLKTCSKSRGTETRRSCPSGADGLVQTAASADCSWGPCCSCPLWGLLPSALPPLPTLTHPTSHQRGLSNGNLSVSLPLLHLIGLAPFPSTHLSWMFPSFMGSPVTTLGNFSDPWITSHPLASWSFDLLSPRDLLFRSASASLSCVLPSSWPSPQILCPLTPCRCAGLTAYPLGHDCCTCSFVHPQACTPACLCTHPLPPSALE